MRIAPIMLALSVTVMLTATPGWAAWPLPSDCKKPSKLLADYNRWASNTGKQCLDSTRGIAGGGAARLSCCRDFEEQWYNKVNTVCASITPTTKLIPDKARKNWVSECNK